MSYSEWEDQRLSEIVEITMGQSPKSEFYNQNKVGKPFLQGNRTFGLKYPSFDTWCTNPKKIAKKNDVLMSVRAPVGDLNIANKDLCIGRGLCSLRMKNENNEFLYYLLEANIKGIVNVETGSVFGSINKKTIESLKFKIPSIHEQKAIANILSSLDDKIELNNKINKNLEEIAQALYKQWFVDFEFPNEDGEPYKSSGGEFIESELGSIPRRWRVKKLKVIMDFIKDSAKAGDALKNRFYTPIDVLPKKQLVIDNYKSYEEAKSSLLLYQKYDILIGAMRVYFHRVNLAPFNGITRTTTFVIRGKNQDDVAYNLLTLNQESTIEYANGTSRGSTMPYAVWENGLGEMRIAFPLIETRMAYNKLILPMLNQIIGNTDENRRLSKLRDILLPKLMNGEIEVPIKG